MDSDPQGEVFPQLNCLCSEKEWFSIMERNPQMSYTFYLWVLSLKWVTAPTPNFGYPSGRLTFPLFSKYQDLFSHWLRSRHHGSKCVPKWQPQHYFQMKSCLHSEIIVGDASLGFGALPIVQQQGRHYLEF